MYHNYLICSRHGVLQLNQASNIKQQEATFTFLLYREKYQYAGANT